MTACVNKKSKRVAAVVTASLVSALSIGAPAVALATGSDISMQSAGALQGGTLTAAEDGQRGIVNDLKGVVELQELSGQFLIPTEITDAAGTVHVLNDDYTLTYFRYADGSYKEVHGTGNGTLDKMYSLFSDPSNEYVQQNSKAGAKYKVVLKSKQDSSDTKEIFFEYVKKSSSDVYTAYDVNAKGEINVEDTTFTYNAVAQTPKFAVDGDADTEFKGAVAYLAPDGSTVEAKNLINAGTYTAKLGTGSDAKYVKFTIGQLDLSEVSASVEDTDVAPTSDNILSSIKVSGVTNTSSVARVTAVSDPNGGSDFAAGSGKYEVTLGANLVNGKENSNVKGSATVTYYVLDKDLAGNVCYGSNKLGDSGKAVNISLEDGEAFDASKIKVVSADEDTYKGSKLEVSYTDSKTGKKVDASALAQKGAYLVSVRVVPSQDVDGKWVGGYYSFTVNVNEGSINADKNLAFVYDGKVVSGTINPTYDGTDFLKEISATVKDSEGNVLEAGKDYKIVATKGGKEVDSIVDYGNYVVTVEGLTFSFSGTNELKVNVAKKVLSDNGNQKLQDLLNNNTAKPGENSYDLSKDFSLFYTGSELEVPAVMVDVDDTAKTDFQALDSKLYKVVSIKKGGKTVKSIKDEGTYTVKVALTEDAAKNHSLTDTEFTVEVLKKKSFGDVAADKWYAEALFKAKENGYVHGVGSTNLFSPEVNITRADAVCIIFNMAGGEFNGMGDFEYNENKGWITGFNDVDGNAYYAKALAWANAVDVANGSNGSFRPNDKITREEFAALLCNYAKATGNFEAVDTDAVLAGVSDAGTVSDWAKDVVAWAVSNKVMGNGGFVAGSSDILRCEVAAMAVNYQPAKL